MEIRVKSTNWQQVAQAWQLNDFEFRESKLVGPDERALWRHATFYHVAGFIADAMLVLRVEKGATASERQQRKALLAPRKEALVDFMIKYYPGARPLEYMAHIIDSCALLYQASKQRFRAPEYDGKGRSRLRAAKATIERELAAEIERSKHPAEAHFRAVQRDELERIRGLPISPSRFARPWHDFACEIYWSYFGTMTDPTVLNRSCNTMVVRLVQQVLMARVGEHVERPAILKVLSKEIAFAKALVTASIPAPLTRELEQFMKIHDGWPAMRPLLAVAAACSPQRSRIRTGSNRKWIVRALRADLVVVEVRDHDEGAILAVAAACSPQRSRIKTGSDREWVVPGQDKGANAHAGVGSNRT
jgi:hypothetical protein